MVRYHNELLTGVQLKDAVTSYSMAKENTIFEKLQLWLEAPGMAATGTMDWIVYYNGIQVATGSTVASSKLAVAVWTSTDLVPLNNVAVTCSVTVRTVTSARVNVRWVGYTQQINS